MNYLNSRNQEISSDILIRASKIIEDVRVKFDSFPLDLKVKDFMGNTVSVIQIQGAEFNFDKDYSPNLTITITGEKKSGSSDSGYDMISYKLYDSAGYLVDSGNIYLSSLSAGDKFKDDSVVIYDITPGESYTFQLSEYSWWAFVISHEHKGLGLSQKWKQGVSAVSRNALFFGVGTHRICLLYCKKIPVNPRRFSQV